MVILVSTYVTGDHSNEATLTALLPPPEADTGEIKDDVDRCKLKLASVHAVADAIQRDRSTMITCRL
jgi:hypothetical protein